VGHQRLGEMPVLDQGMVDGHGIDPGRLHRHMAAPQRGKPPGRLSQPPVKRLEGRYHYGNESGIRGSLTLDAPEGQSTGGTGKRTVKVHYALPPLSLAMRVTGELSVAPQQGGLIWETEVWRSAGAGERRHW